MHVNVGPSLIFSVSKKAAIYKQIQFFPDARNFPAFAQACTLWVHSNLVIDN